MPSMRHVVDVMRHRPQEGEQGELNTPEGTPYRKDIPCSIEPTRGQEAERMHQMYGTTGNKVVMYGDPNKQIKKTDWLIDEFGKRINIVDINDPFRNQQGTITLLCVEEAA